MATPSLPFSGPLFVVGAPRSGTKLLRAILNQHPGVAIPGIETEFLPFWAANWDQFGDLSNRDDFRRFHVRCRQYPFFVYLDDAGDGVDADAWHAACRSFSPAAVFEALIRTHLALDPADRTVWGDKSPSYLAHIPLLRRLYPGARIIHIVRDVRDYCLSINRAWGKHMLRAAQRWTDDVMKAHRDGMALGADYLEVRYEDLLGRPQDVVAQVCGHLGIEFLPGLLELGDSTENIGDARGRRGIVQGNVAKYRSQLSGPARKKIEAIAQETLQIAGYRCGRTGHPVRLGALRMRYYQFLDGINLLRFSARERGMRGALRFVLSYFRISGNRRRNQRDAGASPKTHS